MPARLPTEVKRLRGTLRKDEPLPPEAPAGVPRPSRALPPDVKREWRRLVRELETLGMTSRVDGLALELGAQALAEVWRLDEFLREHGGSYTVTTKAGGEMVRQRPEVAHRQDAWRRASQVLQQLGLTPVSRAKVDPPAAPPARAVKDKWAPRAG
jgi:P27 family predicted phage terminase small subunit